MSTWAGLQGDIPDLSGLDELELIGILHNPQLNSTLPNLTSKHLKKVYFNNNHFIHGPLPSSWMEIGPSLQTVFISFSPGLNGTLPMEWGSSLTGLEEIWVEDCSLLSGTVPEEWKGMRNLKIFNVKGTKISSDGATKNVKEAMSIFGVASNTNVTTTTTSISDSDSDSEGEGLNNQDLDG